MTNPFEDPDGRCFVLVNEEGQYSLWPAFVDVPAGWRVARQEDTYEASIEFVNMSWTDLRLKTLT